MKGIFEGIKQWIFDRCGFFHEEYLNITILSARSITSSKHFWTALNSVTESVKSSFNTSPYIIIMMISSKIYLAYSHHPPQCTTVTLDNYYSINHQNHQNHQKHRPCNSLNTVQLSTTQPSKHLKGHSAPRVCQATVLHRGPLKKGLSKALRGLAKLCGTQPSFTGLSEALRGFVKRGSKKF